ncbi:MAG TPA: sugar ABC transporter substrate-binding protein [Chloroflexota bacterium]|nr:sugar ABC transporter substrate-binding protein [Chloroflexota bacterium]
MKRLWFAFAAALIGFSGLGGATWAASSHMHVDAKKKSGKIKITGCTAHGTISYMFWGDKGDDAAHLAAIKAAEKACPGLKVNPIWDSGNYDTDLATKIGSGNAPDLFQLDASKRIPEYVSEHALAPLNSFISKYKVNMNVFWKQCVNEMTYKGKIWGLPETCSNQSMLFYNKEMFKARHVAYPTDNWTYQQLAAAGAKLSGTYTLPHSPQSELRFGIAQNTDDFRTEQFMWDWGGDWLTPNLKTCTMTSKQSRAGLQFFHDLSYKYHAMPTAAQASGMPDYFSGFQQERYAMAFMGPWALDYAFGKTPGGKKQIHFGWGVVPTPKGPVSRQAVMAATAQVVSANSPHKNAAFWLARFVAEGPGAIYEGSYGVDTPGAKALWNNPKVVAEFGKNVLRVARLGNKTGRYPRLVPQYDKFWNTISTDMKPFWADTASVQSVTSKACSDVKSQGLLP